MTLLLEFGGHFPGADDGEADALGSPVGAPAAELAVLAGFGLPEVVDDDERVVLIGSLGSIDHVI